LTRFVEQRKAALKRVGEELEEAEEIVGFRITSGYTS
jgi:hypothetical protein